MALTGLPIPPDWKRSLPVTAEALAAATAMSPRASGVYLNESAVPWHRQGGLLMPLARSAAVGTSEMEAVFAWVGACSREDWLAGDDAAATVTDTSGTRWQAAAYTSGTGLCAAFRRLPDAVPTIDQLGLPGDVRRLAAQASGLVIATGSGRSGRTTTLAAMLGLVNATRCAHILTIEHPVEYLHEPKLSLVSQCDAPQGDRARSAATALTSDPDVVMVGDCVTTADFEMCLALAAAGRLVLTCVHASDSAAACERIAAAVGPADQMLLAQTLKGVIAQRLVPDASDASGCHAVSEVLVMSSALRPFLKPDGDIDALRGHLLNQRKSLDHALAAKCREGAIIEDDARSHSVDPDAFDSLLRRAIMF